MQEQVTRLVIATLPDNDAPIVMMPFVKHIASSTMHEAPTVTPSVPVSTTQKSVPTKPIASQTTLQKIAPKQEQKKVPSAPAKKSQATKPALVPAATKQQPVAAKDVVPKHEHQPSLGAMAQIEPEHVSARASLSATTTVADFNAPPKPVQEALVVGRDDLALLRMAREIKENLERDWVRPAGVSEYALYKVVVMVDRSGEMDVVEEHASGVLALDLQARNFIMRYQFPPHVWGKEIELVL